MVGNQRVTVRASLMGSKARAVAEFPKAVYTLLGIGRSAYLQKGLITGVLQGSTCLADDAEVLCTTENVRNNNLSYSFGGFSPATKAAGEAAAAGDGPSDADVENAEGNRVRGESSAKGPSSGSLDGPVRGKRAAAALGATSVMGGSNTVENHGQTSKRCKSTQGGGRGDSETK
jgi:hypothetical protein